MFILNSALRVRQTPYPEISHLPTKPAAAHSASSHVSRQALVVSKTERVVLEGRRFYSEKPSQPSNVTRINQDNRNSWFNWSRVVNNQGTMVKASGGGVLALIVAGIAGYLYCENSTDKEFCDSVRNFMGIKKK